MAFCIIVGIISFSEPLETKAAGMTLEDLQEKFPGGKYWNHATQDGHDIDEVSPYYHHGPCNKPDECTSYPCTNHDIDIRGAGYYDCNWLNGLQCYGFVCKLSDDVYGDSNPMAHWGTVSIDNAKAGDVIQFNSGLVHYAMIIGRNGTTVTLGECNYDYHCRIDWGRPCDVSGESYLIYSAPWELPRTPQGSLMPNGGSRVIPDGDYQIVTSMHSNKNLTVAANSTTDGANVQLWDSVEHEEQTFHIQWLGADKGYKITYKLAEPREMSLTVDGNDKSFSRLNVDIWGWYENPGQMWVINGPDSEGYYTIQARSSGFYLDVEDGKTSNGTNIWMYEGNGTSAQKWRFIPFAKSIGQTISDGEYKIVPASNDKYVLGAESSSPVEGSNIQLCAVDKIDKDRRNTFNVRYLGDGKYNITSHSSGLRLDLSRGQMTNGANLQLYTPADANNQRWIIRRDGEESYNIISRTNGLYVDIFEGNLQDGQNIQLWTGHGQDNQRWRFIPWDPNPKITASIQASEITYGQTLSDSLLTGLANTVGSFSWKDNSIRPACSDSEKTRYKVVFTPSDTVSWNSVETEITVKVNPSPNTPNMPDSVMKADQEKQTVGDMVLPDGWVWQDGDNAVKLQYNVPITATAIYIGNDKGNYIHERVSISITKSDCRHPQNRQKKRDAREASCEKEGYTGDAYCTNCQSIIEKGHSIPALGHDYQMEMIKEPTKDKEGERRYTCSRCKDTYTETVSAGILYQITLNASKGGRVTGAGKYLEGEFATVTAVPDSGFRFVRWVENPAETTPAASEKLLKTASPSNAKRQSEAEDEAVAEGSIWKSSKQGIKESIVSTEAKYTFIVTGNRSLTAVFEAIEVPSEKEYTINFQTNGGSLSQDFAITQNGRIPELPVPVRSGYSFKGWFTGTGDGSQVTLDTVFTENTTIYARWDKIEGSADGSGGNTGDSDDSGGDSGNSGGNSSGSAGDGSNSGNSGESTGGSTGGSGSSSGNTGESGSSGGSTGGSGGSTGGSGGSSGGSTGGSGGGSGGSSGGSGGRGGSSSGGGGASGKGGPGVPGSLSAVSIPDYVVDGNWIPNDDMSWQFVDSKGNLYVNTWAAVKNPFANPALGQSLFDWFFFDQNGIMITGWYQEGENWFYLNPNMDGTRGRMITGWIWIPDQNGIQKCYYFNPVSDGTRGKLIQNSVVDGYTVNENGVWAVNGIIQTK